MNGNIIDRLNQHCKTSHSSSVKTLLKKRKKMIVTLNLKWLHCAQRLKMQRILIKLQKDALMKRMGNY